MHMHCHACAYVERWALGRGLLQVGAAYEWLLEHANEPLADVRFVVSADNTGKGTAMVGRGRGIYLREPQHTRGDVACLVNVKPMLHEDAANAERVALDVLATLTSSAPWVSCASSLALMHAGKGLDVTIACGRLPAGCHFAEVVGTDAAKPSSMGTGR